MRMKNRFCRMEKTLLGAMCLLSTCGITYSCSDDYDLDETSPTTLGGSIYDELKARNFRTVVRLIDDLGYAETLSKTGSKTLFVADENAYAKFFANNNWKDGNGQPVRSYEQLSKAQKRLLLNNAMLNNPYVLEMMSNTEGSEGKNLCLRQGTAASATDTIRFWKPEELPHNLNEVETQEDGTVIGDERFWDTYTQAGTPGIYMALDKTSPMMTHFLEGQLKDKQIKHSDIAFILNLAEPWAEDAENRSYIYGSRVVDEDVTCLNGYFNVLDSVLVTPPNMAEVIRSNGQTSLFSAMLDRFSAPFYSAELTQLFRNLQDIGDQDVYEKRYISSRSQSGPITSVNIDSKTIIPLNDFPYLTYDPGWNEYAISSTTVKENDMGAMFVPSDAAMEEFFIDGQGRVLMERYAKKENTRENLLYNLYQIPLDIIQALINNLMKDSFNESVPSKYLTIMNDAQDNMFAATAYPDEAAYRNLFEKVLMANNGVVYVMKRVIPPADYAAVIAPALYSENARIMRAIARADENFIEGNSFNNAPLKQYYSTYLKAMQSRFSFFVPTDDALGSYGLVDPMSLARNAAASSFYRYWRLKYSNKNNPVIPIQADAFKYNVATGQRPEDTEKPSGSALANTSAPSQSLSVGTGLIKKCLLIDMMDQHIVVHENDDEQGVAGPAKYYLSRSGAPVLVKSKGDASDNNVGMVVNGGLQVQLNSDEYPENDHDCVVTEGYDQTGGEVDGVKGYGNGMTYFLDRPMQATTRSVYNVLSRDEEHFSEFFELCETSFSEDLLKLAGFNRKIVVNAEEGTMRDMTPEEWAAEQNKYRIFTNANGYNPVQGEKLVRFFNNYRYTVYAPTNAAIEEARSKGLPTYEEIESFIESNTVTEGDEVKLSPENQLKAQAMITMLINFVKYHFQDQSFFVDNVTSEGSYQTSCIDNEQNTYISLAMKQTNGAITVTDRNGTTQNVIEPYNLLARDANFDKSPSSTAATGITNSSYAVIHQVGKVLNFVPLEGGRYDNAWTTAKKARDFVRRYAVK